MSNTGFGLRLVGTTHGGRPRIREYFVPATDATALFQGDVVKLVNAMDPNNEVPVVTRAATGNILLGVLIGFKPLPAQPYTAYRLASTATYVEVCDDVGAIYEIQEDGVTSRVTAAQIGAMYNIPLNVIAGSTVTGLSGTMATSASATQSTSDLKIVGVRRDVTNPGLVAGTTGAILLVTLQPLAVALNAAASQS